MNPVLPAESPEQRARRQIDAMLVGSGWAVQDRKDMNLAAAPGVAVRELPTGAGPADYALFLGDRLVGVVEAKRAGKALAEVEAQTRDYAAKAPRPLQVPVRPLPFLYESTGVETFFTNGLDPDPRARRVFAFHRPAALRAWLDAELDRRAGQPGAPAAPTLKGRMRLAPPLDTTRMWPAQIRAVENLEASFREGKPRALVQMATGSGKTFTAISAIYRLVRHGGARRVLFLVDRGNLGKQALKEFQAYTTPDDGRKFTELYNAVNLTHNTVDPGALRARRIPDRCLPVAGGGPSMTPIRLVFYVVDPFADVRQVIAALVAAEHGVTVVRAPAPDLPAAARANVERILSDLDVATTLDPLPFEVGAQAVGGVVLFAPVPPADAPAWVRQALLPRAA